MDNAKDKSLHLVIGASSKIALAFIKKLTEQNPTDVVVSFSQKTLKFNSENIHHFSTNYSDESISNSVSTFQNTYLSESVRIKTITFFNGQLHSDLYSPEKSIRQFDPAYAQALFNSNVITPMLWLKRLVKLLNRSDNCVVTALSARVGSIEDNGLGGWYSYRSSKSALNMMMKSFAIELKRQSPKSTVLLFHPGTTDTPLSKPFQKNVPDGKLFEPEFVAECLYKQVAESDNNDLINYLDWQGQSIQW
ncbi:SDR family NAD(P)-dependent oxidoreductase [Pseudoalteromonas phenolica]|uniref:Short-chain dehydrogenase n=1 Tax=Pseudoalteromonas phenolica TaxID=161398 RepID=A0A0S2K891_9GAMM|nr:SDR family NAD(P)-dependent oxidoreductase [Pseudoalteromonas phenolica]ALO44583.1 hypothetical protein PP2015_4116 [Pseudoalteromonas phenolica]MBE0357615.1 hypothetical protein [Pseudoalteromonas phenolica O-BC30]RXF02615.1 SDR family NAD(P)-dependent oxidoreductase [Pseudoalteromonas phenolica O-BC30]